MAIIKVDSVFFRNLSAYLEKLSDIRVNQAKELHTVNAQGLLGEAKAYLDAKDELDNLLKELEEEFTVEEGS